MPNPTEPNPVFAVGTRVRVKPGTPPDYPDFPIGGWAGTIQEIQQDVAPLRYLVKFDIRTLVQVHPIYRKRCERDDFSATHMWLREDDIEPATGEPTVIEQPTRIESDYTDEYDGIRDRLGLTADDV